DLHEDDMAYSLFERATMIDMSGYPKSSDAGVHAASLGGIWQCCVLGFGGVRRYGDALRIQPNLPEKWNSVSFCIYWHGQRLSITATHEQLSVKNLTGTADVQFLHDGKLCSVGDGVTVKL
ncbi:MAG: glycosyl hydrolase family 65 protein, partial [Candidatus Avispirillum sp.]